MFCLPSNFGYARRTSILPGTLHDCRLGDCEWRGSGSHLFLGVYRGVLVSPRGRRGRHIPLTSFTRGSKDPAKSGTCLRHLLLGHGGSFEGLMWLIGLSKK